MGMRFGLRRSAGNLIAVLTLGLAINGSALASEGHHDHQSMDHSGHGDMSHDGHMGHDMNHGDAAEMDHSKHMAMMKKTNYRRSTVNYTPPQVTLLNQKADKVELGAVIKNDKPVVLNFIFTTCTTICPVLSATFSQFDQMLTAEEKAEVRLVSISIDPEQDRPSALAAYAEKFSAGDNWTFLTGELNDIIAVLKSFDAYRGNKMNHEPVTLLRKAGAEEWVRLDGLTSARDLAGEYRTLAADEGMQHHDHHSEHQMPEHTMHDHHAMQ